MLIALSRDHPVCPLPLVRIAAAAQVAVAREWYSQKERPTEAAPKVDASIDLPSQRFGDLPDVLVTDAGAAGGFGVLLPVTEAPAAISGDGGEGEETGFGVALAVLGTADVLAAEEALVEAEALVGRGAGDPSVGLLGVGVTLATCGAGVTVSRSSLPGMPLCVGLAT